MSDDKVPPADRSGGSTKEQAAKFHTRLREWIETIFALARVDGNHLTPDEAMTALDEVLKKRSETLAKKDPSAQKIRRPVRIDVVAALQKAHHHAVDVYYQTYFPRKTGMEGKPRRGAPRLPDEYVDEIIKLLRLGKNSVQIASALGEEGPEGLDRTSKRIGIARKRWAEAVARVRRLDEDRKARIAAATIGPQPRKNHHPKRKHAKSSESSSPK